MDRNARDLGSILAAVLAAWLWVGPARAVEAGPEDLRELSLEELLEVEVTSVSKRAQRLAETPAAVYVIDQEQIRRSGMQTVPDLLRLVPGLHVANINANQWAISARGFNTQFANKLLVMIDGRTVYNPVFSGVFWDVPDLPLEDIKRIEVVRGPGGTIWGANAVNGVINIITKEARETQGLLLSSEAGLHQRFGGVGRWGGALGDDFHYRAYVKGFDRRGYESPLAGGGTAHDGWDQVRGGFRSEWNATADDVLTFQGEYYSGESDELRTAPPLKDTWEDEGGNFLTRWSHLFSEDSDLVAQAYYDRYERADVGSADFEVDTADIEVRHRYAELPRNEIVWGVNYRHHHVSHHSPTLSPLVFKSEEAINMAGFFIQDEITLMPGLLKATIGSKFGWNEYSDFEYQPSGRILLTPHENHAIWAAVSRAVGMPSQGEASLTIVNPFLVVPSTDPKAEKVLAYEVGYRATPLPNVTVDVAAYYNDYKDLRTCDFTGLGPGKWANSLESESWGVELALGWQATSFLRLMGAYTFMDVDSEMPATSMTPENPSNPEHQFNIRSFLDLPWDLTLDSQVFWVGGIDNLTYLDGGAPKTLGDFVRFDTRLAWAPRPDMEFSLVGQNLTRSKHAEFGNQFTELATLVPRSFYGKVTWRY